MINYDYFAVIAKTILDGDPELQYDNFTVRKVDCDDTWTMILDHCSSIKADVRALMILVWMLTLSIIPLLKDILSVTVKVLVI